MVAETTTAQHKLKRVYGNLESLRGIGLVLLQRAAKFFAISSLH